MARRRASRGDDFAVFSGDATAYGVDGNSVSRAPLQFAPRSNTTLNFERLPPPEALRGMSLAAREFPFPVEAGRWPLVEALGLYVGRSFMAALVVAVAAYGSRAAGLKPLNVSIRLPIVAWGSVAIFLLVLVVRIRIPARVQDSDGEHARAEKLLAVYSILRLVLIGVLLERFRSAEFMQHRETIDLPLVASAGFACLVALALRRLAEHEKLPTKILGFGRTIVLAGAVVAVGASLPLLVTTPGLTSAAVFLTLVVFFLYGREPTLFFHDWLYTHPQLKPDTRARHPYWHVLGLRFRKTDVSPSWFSLVAILGSLVVGSRIAGPLVPIAVTAGCAGIGILAYVTTWPRKPVGLFSDVLVRYRYYGLFASGAPGVWVPRSSLMARNRQLGLLVGSLAASLALGTSGFAPWDIPVLHPALPDTTLRSWPLAWVWPSLTNTRWSFLLLAAPLVLGPAMVGLALIGIYGPAVARLAGLAWKIEEELDRYHTALDETGTLRRVTHRNPRTGREEPVERSPWECFVERLAGSTHVAAMPRGRSR